MRSEDRIAKNKCAPPFCEAEFEIRWGPASELRKLRQAIVAAGPVRPGRRVEAEA